MRCLKLAVWFWVMALALAAQAEDTLTIQRKIVLPDGTPAAGATVTIRTYGGEGVLLQELVTQTGADGLLNATVKYIFPMGPMGPVGNDVTNGYLMVDMPHCALAIGRLVGGKKTGGTSPSKVVMPYGTGAQAPLGGFIGGGGGGGGGPLVPMKLLADYQQSGIVLNKATNAPVPGAQVAVVSFNPAFEMNLGWPKVSTAVMRTTAGDDGVFTLRGVSIEQPGGAYLYNAASAFLVARQTIDDKVLVGELRRFAFSPTAKPAPQQVLLAPTTALEGLVVDAQTRAPLAGATVRLRASNSLWTDTLPTQVTGTDGRYRFPAITPATSLYVLATASNYTPGLAQVGRVGGTTYKPEPLPDIVTARAISLRPMGPPVTLKVVDAVTGHPPLPSLRVGIALCEAVRDDYLGAIGGSWLYTYTDANGVATTAMPLGMNAASVDGPGYSGRVTVTSPANAPVTVPIPRRTGLLIHFTTTNPHGLHGIVPRLRGGDGAIINAATSPIDANGFKFFELWRPPPGPYQLSVSRDKQDVVPWTEVQPATWPTEVVVP